MNYLDAVLLGLVEGLTEFLPISSTGHLILVSHMLGLAETDFLKSFEIAIQLGAICAVVVLFWKSFLHIDALKKLFVAFVPTAVIGLALYSFIKTHLLGSELTVVMALLLGGIVLICFEYFHRESIDATPDIESISYKQAFGIGLFQAIAIIPGVSRSAASILGGLLLGLKRTTIVQFSFLLAVPTMAAATGLDLLKSYKAFSLSDAGLLSVGFITAFVVALLVMRLFLSYVRTRTFVPFGIYRIVIAVLFFFVFIGL
ncbi:undecaprenyl-diphosphate phosphatase [Patescibacteria group bacterium]|nr:undecaprenyl-diphosphate phosphatase [Patescibacteria group bacterium]